LAGSFRKSTISRTSSFASSTPRDVGERDRDLLRIDRPRLLERRHATGDEAEEGEAGESEEQQPDRERPVAARTRRFVARDADRIPRLGQVRDETSDWPRT
jgi:hypothetical protein